MPLPIIQLENDHRLEDCGTGDYALRCPTHGKGPWVHMGTVLRAFSERVWCERCGLPAKPVEPFPEMLARGFAPFTTKDPDTRPGSEGQPEA